MDPLYIALWIAAGILIGIILTAIGSRIMGSRHMSKARREAAQAISDAEREAATILKEAQTELKEQRIELRAEVEREAREQRRELVTLEKRILAKEESVDKRVELLEAKSAEVSAKERDLSKREQALAGRQEEIERIIQQQRAKLESVSGMSAEQARRELFTQLENEVRRDTALRLKRIEDELVENSEKRAQWVISQAIQRCAADHVAESTVSVVDLPNDEMKGRIIGREGRNIRALESVTGINIIIDDTPEAVILSGFDPIRREVARIALERLIQDGRIHPARIEEVVAKVQEEMNTTVKELGEAACLETGVHGLHPEIVKLLGRLNYRTSYGQNVLRHAQEVCHLAGMMAAELGLNVQEAKRAALIHDIGKAVTHEVEGSHAVIGADFARRYGESPNIANSIGAHHNEQEKTSVIAVLVQAADALSAARPGARRETIESYVKRLEQLEALANGFDGVEKSYALQAGREVRLAVLPDKVDDAQASQLAREVARKVEQEMTYPGQIRITVIRETRASETAN
jgi:ribonuclease Y